MSSVDATPNRGKHQNNGKSPAPEQDSEVAPLLTENAPVGENEEDGFDGASEQASKNKKSKTWLGRSWHWLQSNLMIVALVLLLLGGLIALLVYFAGTFRSRSLVSHKLNPVSSCLQPKNESKACYYLSYSCLRTGCIRNS